MRKHPWTYHSLLSVLESLLRLVSSSCFIYVEALEIPLRSKRSLQRRRLNLSQRRRMLNLSNAPVHRAIVHCVYRAIIQERFDVPIVQKNSRLRLNHRLIWKKNLIRLTTSLLRRNPSKTKLKLHAQSVPRNYVYHLLTRVQFGVHRARLYFLLNKIHRNT